MAKTIFIPQNDEQRVAYMKGIQDGSIPLNVKPNAYFAVRPKSQKKKGGKNGKKDQSHQTR